MQKSLSKRERQRRLDGKAYPDLKPDIDNYIKAFFDGINGVIWADDKQVVDLIAQKRYAQKGYILLDVMEILDKE